MPLFAKIKYGCLLIMILMTAACDKDPAGEALDAIAPLVESNFIDPVSGDVTVVETPDQTISEQFMDLVNDHRATLGLRALINNDDVTAIAQIHSVNMASGTVAFGHLGFSARCGQARTALSGGNMCGENVASGQKTAQTVFNSWMNSPGHRANIEQPRYTHSGFGFKKSASGSIYWTHLFVEEN